MFPNRETRPRAVLADRCPGQSSAVSPVGARGAQCQAILGSDKRGRMNDPGPRTRAQGHGTDCWANRDSSETACRLPLPPGRAHGQPASVQLFSNPAGKPGVSCPWNRWMGRHRVSHCCLM